MKLKTARLMKELTQKEVAEILGISLVTYGDWERGKSPMTAKALQDASKLFGVSADGIELPELRRSKNQ